MPGTTFKSWFNSRKWYFKEHHLEWLANELDQILNSTYGPAGGNTTVIGGVIIDNAADGATTIGAGAAGTFSGQFNGANAGTVTAGGRTIMRADPRGGATAAAAAQGFGPGPGRIIPPGPPATPTEGFTQP